jgi:SWI/SNF-related matrix-associated actin-dependent regulator of chromatin subfamily A containing DEAD/H box 1
MDILSDEYFKDICPGLVLKAYQLVGVNWLKLLHENNINGVLADDMGLGKTVQSVAFLGWLKNSRPSSAESTAHLIVVPASTLSNWENELRRFCPSLSVVSYHGTQNERAELRYDLKRDIRAGRVDVVLSTFTIFERESGKDDRSFLYKQNFEYLIVDEAHCLKVSTSARFTNMNAIRAGHRLLLSGTPVQNDLGELLSLMSFTMPKLFRNIDIEDVLEGFGWDKKSGVPSSSSSSVSINQLRGMLAPFVLRRIKSDVLDQLVDKVS